MRTIKIIFLSLLALSLIASTGVYIFFETFDTDRYLTQITKKASLALGRPVSIGNAGLGLSQQGITLDVWPLTIGDDLGFTAQPFIKIDRVRISLGLRSLFLQRAIHITGILLQSPQIHFIRSQEGNINIRSLGQANRSSIVIHKNSVILSAAKDLKAPLDSSPLGLRMTTEENRRLPIFIKSIRIQDASISFIDQSQGMPLDVWLLNINASLNNFSMSKPFQLSFDASPLVFKSISQGDPDSPVFKNITGDVQLNLAPLEIGASGDFKANGDIIITEGVIKNFNIIKTVLSHTLGAFGGMEGNIEKLGADNTIIEKAQAQFSVHDKTVFIDDSLIKTDIFEFTAKGSVDQGLNMDMQTMLHLNGDVSAALVNKIDGLKYLMDDTQRIAIGGRLNGVIPHLKYKLDKDFRKKSKKALMEEGGNILGVLLGDGQTTGQGQDASSQDPGKKPKTNFKNILKNFLQ